MDRKTQILDEVLANAAFDGWSDIALNSAAKSVCGNQKYAQIEFPAGISDLSQYYSEICDAEMNQILDASDIKSLKIRERIKLAVITRLEIYNKNKEAVRAIIARRAMPDAIWQSVVDVGHTVDDMWSAAGDESTDYNYYSKRFILSGVYTSTLLFWLQDESEDFTNTKDFLSRRIDNVMQFEKLKGQVLDTVNSFTPHK